MIKKKKEEREIEVNNINADIIRHFYCQEYNTNDNFYKPNSFLIESCGEDIDTSTQNLSNNIKKLISLRESETIEINPDDINIDIIEYIMRLENVQLKPIIEVKHTKKIIKKIQVDENIKIKQDIQSEEIKTNNHIMEIFEDIISANIISTNIEEVSNDTTVSEQNSSSVFADKRLEYFLKKTNPTFYKSCDDIKDYVEKTEASLLKKGRLNAAIQPSQYNLNKYKSLHVSNGFQFVRTRLEHIKESFWTNEEKNKFKRLVFNHKNSLEIIKKEFTGKTMKDVILRYYCSKDKTWNYIKKKSGRISETESHNLITGTWTEIEKTYFNEKYPIFGKSLTKYQGVILKSIKELKIYLKWFLKNKMPIKKKSCGSSFLDDWSTDERQIFAIYYPFFNKNWITMSGHFSSKSSKDLKSYYMKYFKYLSLNEQRFETYLKDFNLKSRTDPVLHKGEDESSWCDSVGWIFKSSSVDINKY